MSYLTSSKVIIFPIMVPKDFALDILKKYTAFSLSPINELNLRRDYINYQNQLGERYLAIKMFEKVIVQFFLSLLITKQLVK